MKSKSFSRFIRLTPLFAMLVGAVRASDHADPMSLDVLRVQKDRDANITDLHAFVVDGSGHLVTEPNGFRPADRLVISLCVRRALQPAQIEGLDLAGYKFRV